MFLKSTEKSAAATTGKRAKGLKKQKHTELCINQLIPQQ